MKDYTTVLPSPVVKEIARRRLADNKLSKSPPMGLPCHLREKLIQKPFFCGSFLKVRPKPERNFLTKKMDIHLPEIETLKNPFCVPAKHHIFKYKDLQRKKKRTSLPELKVRTIKDDLHNQYFSVVDGRSLRPNKDLTVYLNNIRNIVMLRTDAAFINDKILKIDIIEGDIEINQYKKILDLYHKTLKSFEEFLRCIVADSDNALVKQNEVEEQLQAAKAENEELQYKHYLLKSWIVPMTERIEVLMNYKNFFDKISPVWWRLAHDSGFAGESVAFKKIFLDFSPSISSGSSEYNFADAESELEFMTQHEEKKYVLLTPDTQCVLYFKKPEELMQVYSDIAYFCLRDLDITAYNTTAVMKPLALYRNYLRLQLPKMVEEGKEHIKFFEEHIGYMEEKAEFLENKFNKILNNEFKFAICSYDTLKLFEYIQYVNTKTLGITPDPNDSLSEMTLRLEAKYDELMLQMDYLDYEIVKKVHTQLMREDKEMMKRANDAQRTLRECKNFEKSLYASFEPPRYKNKKLYKELL